MSSISGLSASNIYNLLSSSQNSSQASNSTNSQSGTTSQTASSSLNNLQDVVCLILMEESTSLIQSLFNTNSSQSFVNILETSATLNAIAKTNLLESNPQLAESLLGGTSSTSIDTSDTSPTSSSQFLGSLGSSATTNSSSQSAESSDIASNLLAAIEQSNLSQTNPDLEQSFLQMVQPSFTDVTSSTTPGSILDLIA